MSHHVAVVGAGMVGLSTAWFLQEHGIHVTVYERAHVAAGSSWGNAGWLTPALTAPLPEPAVLALRGPGGAPARRRRCTCRSAADPRLLRFLGGFARHSTARRWGLGMRAYAPLNRRALAAFDDLTEGGVDAAHPSRPTRSSRASATRATRRRSCTSWSTSALPGRT